MESLLSGVQYILGLGPTVVLPIAILCLGLIFGIDIKKSLKSGIIIGIGFVGINLVVGVLVTNIGPAAQAIVERFGFSLTVIDVGWPGIAAATWASPVAPLVIPLCFVVNIVMLATRTTKTLNVDLWNYWHFAVAAATAFVVTNNLWFSLAMAVVMEVAVLITADKGAKAIQEFYGIEGVSLPTGSSASFAPLGWLIGKLVEKIPVINKIELSSDDIQKKFGVFGEPMMVGLVLGMIFGLLAGYDLGGTLKMGIAMGSVMFLMPRMVKILMEGLIPISESIKTFMHNRFGDRDIYIGLDAAVAVGHPALISTALILVPVTIFIAVLLPGNRVLPFGDLATIPFYASYIVAFRKGNIFQSVITAVVVLTLSLYMATDYTPVHTELMQGVAFDLPSGATEMSSLDTGGNLYKWLILKFSQFMAPIIGH